MRRRQPPHQVERAQREGDPAAAQADAPVARPPLQVGAQQRPQLGQDARLDGRVQPVAAEVDAHPGDLVARGRAADPVAALDQRHPVAPHGRAVGGPDARGARAQHQQVGRGQFRAATAVPVPAGQATVGAPLNSSATRAPGSRSGAPMMRARTVPLPFSDTT